MDKLIQWQNEYATGYEQIDNQHKELFTIINLLYEDFRNGIRQDLLKILDKLYNYALSHFSTEEKIFSQAENSLSKQHIAEHNFFKKKIEYFYRQYKQQPAILDLEIILFLKEWIIHHIMGADKKQTSKPAGNYSITLNSL